MRVFETRVEPWVEEEANLLLEALSGEPEAKVVQATVDWSEIEMDRGIDTVTNIINENVEDALAMDTSDPPIEVGRAGPRKYGKKQKISYGDDFVGPIQVSDDEDI